MGDVEGATPAKNVVIKDLHRVAESLKADIKHLDRPAAMLGVFGSAGANQAEVVAKGYYEKLVRRLEVFRSEWSHPQIRDAMTGAFEDVTAGLPKAQPAAVALVVGRRVVAMASPGASYWIAGQQTKGGTLRCVESSVSPASGSAAAPKEDAEGKAVEPHSCCFELAGADSSDVFGIILCAGTTQASQDAVQTAAVHNLQSSRTLAASVSAILAARKAGVAGPLAAACAWLKVPPNPIEVQLPPEKRPKVAASSKGNSDMIRARQILVRFVAKGIPADRLVDPVRRRPVTRSLEEAERIMHEVLSGFDGEEGAVNFAGFAKISQSVHRH